MKDVISTLVEMHKQLMSMNIIQATIRDDDKEYEYCFIDTNEFQFQLKGNMPCNYVDLNNKWFAYIGTPSSVPSVTLYKDE